ncbi:mannose-6-phosphate isomerase [Dictyobacter sp. S3.2.2.5]|uniref:Mannose-6-phosphate isomerase n=1 Tax=Dictyobacter halimunensis TaxID=3026934 RepID=A0ABQ6FZA4_9CHLR|nr:mannose-6-phosphate isomerase [Dictyobacter sp. S3.2.2.5]
MSHIYPIRLRSSLHETIWGGRRLEQDSWKTLPANEILIGESWETEVSNLVQNGEYEGQTLGAVVAELGTSLLGEQATAIFGQRFPLLAKFIDANAQLSVQVHPKDEYANEFEGGKLGKTEFWYILSAEPGASIVHGFKAATDPAAVRQAIEGVQLEELMHAEPVAAGDVVFVPAGTVHAIGGGILLYELQEYSDVTYRMYDYGRLTASGKPRELHIDRSLDVSHYEASRQIKMHPVTLASTTEYDERCLVACKYFLTRELNLKGGVREGATEKSCIILTSLGAEIRVAYGEQFAQTETLSRGQTLVLPADLGAYRIEGEGSLLFSYVPKARDEAWQAWRAANSESAL